MDTVKLADIQIIPRFISFEDDSYKSGPDVATLVDPSTSQQVQFSFAINAKDWRENRVAKLNEIAEAIEAQLVKAQTNGTKVRKPKRARR